ncbi:MAG: aromatic ring-hydroxylating oxygenase subunit alpha [Pseudomonadales bacterium]
MAEARTQSTDRPTSERVPLTPITAERYVSREYQQLEWQRLWPKVWLLAGAVQDVSEPGDYFVFELDPESIVVSRTEAGELRAFYNVCQHRGARVVLSERGNMARYTCPYHGWVYENDGTLCHVPEAANFSRGVPMQDLSLKQLRIEEWGGIVWICMDPEAPPLADFLGPVQAMVAPFRMQDMQMVEDQTVELDCNWKAVFDNFGELYHVEHIHPQHETIFDCPMAVNEMLPGGHTRVLIDGFTVNTRLPIPDEVPASQWAQLQTLGMNKDDYRGRVLEVRRDVQLKKRQLGESLGYNYDLLSDEQLSDIVQYNLFPNAILVLQPDELWILRSRPHGDDPNRCYWDKLAFRMMPKVEGTQRANLSFNLDQDPLPTAQERPEHDQFPHDAIINGEKTMTITLDQDIHLIRDVQKGMHSRGFREAWLSDEEERVQYFHSTLDSYMTEG